MMGARAAVFTAVGRPFEMQEFPLPVLEAGSLLVRVRMCTICGSDLHTWEGRREAPAPPRPGTRDHRRRRRDRRWDGVRPVRSSPPEGGPDHVDHYGQLRTLHVLPRERTATEMLCPVQVRTRDQRETAVPKRGTRGVRVPPSRDRSLPDP